MVANRRENGFSLGRAENQLTLCSRTPEAMEELYEQIFVQGERTKHPKYESFIKDVKGCIVALASEVGDVAKPSAYIKDAKRIVKFLTKNNFNFDLVRTEVLKGKLEVTDAIIDIKKYPDITAQPVEDLLFQYTEIVNIDMYLNLLSYEKNVLFSLSEDISNLKLAKSKSTIKSSNLFTAIKQKGISAVLSMKEKKLAKLVEKFKLTSEDIQELLASRKEIEILEKAIDANENGKQELFTATQEKAIREQIDIKHKPLLDAVKTNAVENIL